MGPARVLVCLGLFLAVSPKAMSEQPAEREFFETRIRPVLIRHCYECHSAASSETQGGLRLDSRDFIRQGGDSGPAVVPGNASESLLLEAIRYESFEMPPDKMLSEKVIADFEKWVEMGAPDPRDRAPTADEAGQLAWEIILAERRQWWSLQPVVEPTPPSPSGQEAVQPIDSFVLAQLHRAGISPGEPANARVLMRRLTLVLTGLPPTPAEVEQFVVAYEKAPEAAYQSLVDRLLDSPHFGEHWARHWMDVVRIAETHGYEWNHEIRDAWRYRDYLIRAFNADVPYDQLVREHIAGDLLDHPRVSERLGINESIIGTAFWRFGELGHDDCVEFPEIRFDAIDNQIDTLGKAFQGLTISCARCHDHKLDAISARDYYALVGVLENCAQVVHTLDSPERISDLVSQAHEIKRELRVELGKQWLSAIDGSRAAYVSAISGKGEAAGQMSKQIADKELDLSDPGYLLGRLHQQETDFAKLWSELEEEYAVEQARRVRWNVENFDVWADFAENEYSGWSTSGLGLAAGATQPGEFTLASEGNRIVEQILPGGLYTNIISDRLNGSLRSPWLATQKKFISLQVLGAKKSMVRTVVDTCALNEFAGGGLEYLDGEAAMWKQFPTSAGDSHRSFVELTSRADNPRWPDRPDRAKSSDPGELDDYRSSFGVMRAVLHDSPGAPLPELDPILALFAQPRPRVAADVATAYQRVAANAVTAWMDERATDADVAWINWLLKVELLPNSAELDPQSNNLLHRYRELVATIPEPRVVAGLADHGTRNGFPVLLGGDPQMPGADVPRRYLEVISGTTGFEASGSGRRGLAEVIASPENPLTARVMVNRLWHYLFGQGIVTTTDDFGRMGEGPSHPQLLDYLAASFINDGWSVKKMVRQIVLSRTFRQSSVPHEDAVNVDPGNRLLHHYPAHRLGAESIRDSILAVSGRLDASLYGPSIHPHRKEEKDYRKLFVGPLDGDGRRSIYTKVTRMEGPSFLELFDFPNPTATRGRRDRTNVPAQALALLNDPFVLEQAEFWAEQLVVSNHGSIEERVQKMFHRALGRWPTDNERQHFVTLIRSFADDPSCDDATLLRNKQVWQDAAHVIFNMKELVYLW